MSGALVGSTSQAAAAPAGRSRHQVRVAVVVHQDIPNCSVRAGRVPGRCFSSGPVP